MAGAVIMDDAGGGRGDKERTPRGPMRMRREEPVGTLIAMDELTNANQRTHLVSQVGIQAVEVKVGSTVIPTPHNPMHVKVLGHEGGRPVTFTVSEPMGIRVVLAHVSEALRDGGHIYKTATPAIITEVDVNGHPVTLPSGPDPITVTVSYA